MTSIRTVDPATGETLAEHPRASDADVAASVARAGSAQAAWARRSVAERVAPLRALAGLLDDDAARHAELMAREMGKPVTQGRAEAAKCASACRHYAAHAARDLAPEPASTDASRSYACFEPLGLVLAVMPWNFPYWQVIRAAVPAIAAGNGVLLKHASSTTGCALELHRLFERAGFPAGLFTTLVIGHEQAEALIAHPAVRAVTLTGSTDAGRAIAPLAARALKPCVLELGGSDPAVVLEDADLDVAVPACVTARVQNAGQSCIAAKRFVVVDAVREDFTRRFVERMRAQRTGSPLDEETEVGPLARADLRDALHAQVRRSVDAGARLLLGGAIPAGKGAFYPPTVLADVRPGMAAFDEETFGPVAAIVPARDEAHAVELANATPFGLGASVYTRDAARGERLAREELQAGSCFVNGLVKSDPRLPFGGVKDSGFGRELSEFGIRSFVNVKTVWVR